ncbi:hypothetical protein AC249_AIPGENE22838 [Exaiptasia diaphana]|nr:hypothetical protein AC249_AIPGENE22838 [Exaiptasia diaphana]
MISKRQDFAVTPSFVLRTHQTVFNLGSATSSYDYIYFPVTLNIKVTLRRILLLNVDLRNVTMKVDEGQDVEKRGGMNIKRTDVLLSLTKHMSVGDIESIERTKRQVLSIAKGEKRGRDTTALRSA